MARGIVTGGLNSAGSNIKSVQRGTVSSLSSTITNIPISSVNMANSIVILDFIMYNSGSDSLGNSIQAKLTSNTNLQLTIGRIPSGTIWVSWQVIQFQNVKSIQTGTLSTSQSSSESHVTISSVDITKSIVFCNMYNQIHTSSTSPCEYSRITATLPYSTSIFFKHTDYAQPVIVWYVVEFY